jgi:HEAT repeat protein
MHRTSLWIRVKSVGLLALPGVLLATPASAVDRTTLDESLQCSRYTVEDCAPLAALVAAKSEAIALAAGALGDEDPKVRTAARRVLGLKEVGDVAAKAAAISKALETIADDRRGDALLALGELAQPESEARLVAVAGDANADARNRIYAAAALANYPSDAARTALEAALFSDTPRLQETAAVALAKTLPASGDALVRRAIGEMTPGFVRIACARALIQGKDARALPVLSLLLAVPNGAVRTAAAEGLAAIGDKRAVPALIVSLSDPDAGAAVARTLGRLGDKRAVPALANALAPGAPNPRVLAALEALAELGGTEMIAQIAPWLQATDLTVAKAAADTLGQLASPGALPHLDAVGDRGDAGFKKALDTARAACKASAGVPSGVAPTEAAPRERPAPDLEAPLEAPGNTPPPAPTEAP